MTKLSATEKYFQEYRDKVRELGRMRDEIVEVRKKVDVMRKNITELEWEISSMRTIITQMVDNGWDPVEAKLKSNGEESKLSYWDTRFDDMANSTQGLTTVATGLTTTITPVSSISISSSGTGYGATNPNRTSTVYYTQKK